MLIACYLAVLDLVVTVAFGCIATSSPEGLPGIGSGTVTTTLSPTTTTSTTTTTTTTTNPCAPGADGQAYEFYAPTGYCYAVKVAGPITLALTSLLKTQPQAQANCAADGGNLASIHSAGENAFLFGLSALTTNIIVQTLGLALQPWIGLEQVGDNLIPIPGTCPASITFQWNDGTPQDFTPPWLSPLGIPIMPLCSLMAITGCTQLVATPLPAPVPPIFVPQGEWYQSACASLVAGRWICKKLPP